MHDNDYNKFNKFDSINTILSFKSLLILLEKIFEYITYLVLYKSFYIMSLVIIILFTYKLYSVFREKFEEVYLFNLESMSEEERKLFIYTRKMTIINEKEDNRKEIQANKGK